MREKYSQFIGIILAVVYGLIIRLLFDDTLNSNLGSVFSITFIWVTPVIIGLIPIVFSGTEIYRSSLKLFFYPMLAVVLYLIVALVTKLEDVICILIIGVPSIISSGLLGLLLGLIVRKRMDNKKMYAILVLPFILIPIENLFPSKVYTYNVMTEIIINQSREEVFPNLLEVPTILDAEYKSGFYQSIGIPRPIESKLYVHNDRMYRIGKFTDNLQLYETVSMLKENEYVNFKIDLKKSTLRNKPTDQHVLNGNYFKFENINYTLIPITENKTKVILNCEYTINSKMNIYANFWAKSIIEDFEERLLSSLKLKLER